MHAESGIEIYRGKGSRRTKSPRRWGIVVGTANFTCYR